MRVGMDENFRVWKIDQQLVLHLAHDFMGVIKKETGIELDVEGDENLHPRFAGPEVVHAHHVFMGEDFLRDALPRVAGKFPVEQHIDGLARNTAHGERKIERDQHGKSRVDPPRRAVLQA